MSIIGNSIPRIDAIAKVTGKARYPGDFQFSDQLVMKVLFAHRAHARVVDIDTTQAEAMNGVVMVLTAKDVPLNEYGLGIKDQPVLCGPGSSVEGADIVRFEGDQVALVIAESETIAVNALKQIKVTYEDLPVVKTLGEALKENAPILHSRLSNNIFHHNIVRRGSTDEAFKHCAVVVEGEYQTPVQEHAYLQPESGVGFLDEQGRITIVSAGQWTHTDQGQVAHALGLANDEVRIIYPAIGGAFGGREDMSVQIILGLAVKRLKERGIFRPVRIVWSREGKGSSR